ncbi:MAG: hypothetical protein SVZ03_05025 [Spirochaetota bacterium]|nr:hypothetical protein [Spirochaetota bacterium]
MSLRMNNISHFLKIIILIFIISFICSCGSIYRHMKKKINNNYQEGIALLKEGEHHKALDRFKTVVSIDPEHKEAKRHIFIIKEIIEKCAAEHYQRGVYYRQKQRYEDALDQFLLVQRESPTYKDTKYKIENIRNSKPIKKKFIAALDDANRLYNKKRYKKAYEKCLLAKKYNPESIEFFTINLKVESALNNLSDPHLEKAKDLFCKKDYRSARIHLKKSIKANPWEKNAKRILRECNEKIALRKLYKRAERGFYNKDYFISFDLFQEIEEKESGYLDAEIYLNRIKKKLSKNLKEYYNNGISYYDREMYQKAISEWDKVLKIKPSDKMAGEYKERALAKLEMKKILDKD